MLTRLKRLTCWNRLALTVVITTLLRLTCASSSGALFSLPSVTPPLPQTNRFHLTFTFDTVSNAAWYSIIVKTNGSECFRRYSMTNVVVVSNLSANLDQYQFTAIATNSIGESAESSPALLHWMSVMESGSISGPWTLLATNSFASTQPQHWIALSNWSAGSLLKPD